MRAEVQNDRQWCDSTYVGNNVHGADEIGDYAREKLRALGTTNSKGTFAKETYGRRQSSDVAEIFRYKYSIADIFPIIPLYQ